MSGFKRKFKLNPPKKQPRNLEEIQKEYAEVSSQLAQAQYAKYVHGLSVRNLSEKMLELNQEAAERNEITKKEQKSKPLEVIPAESTDEKA